MSELKDRQCKPCTGDVEPLQTDAVNNMLEKVAHWSQNTENKEISRNFRFKNYYETMAFVNAVAWVAHHEDHHPDMEVGYNRCNIVYSTHTIGGLSENDFICAAKINALCPDRKPDE